tara:strand:- start:540 stop:746 length:207 start_codon:yes stop_codon:yes gene_type:complete
MKHETILELLELTDEFWHENKKAEVWRDSKGNWCTRHYENKVWQYDIVHEGKSKFWAEDAAENYVLLS